MVTKKRTLKWLLAATLIVLGVVGTFSFAFGSKGPDYLPKGALSPLVPPEHGPEAKTAAEMLAQGRPKEAASYLMSHAKEVREKPYAQMVLGHAQASAQRSIQALIAYTKAISLEPKLAKDKLMRTNIELMLDKKAPGVVDAVIEFLGKLVTEADDWAAADQLGDGLRLALRLPEMAVLLLVDPLRLLATPRPHLRPLLPPAVRPTRQNCRGRRPREPAAQSVLRDWQPGQSCTQVRR